MPALLLLLLSAVAHAAAPPFTVLDRTEPIRSAALSNAGTALGGDPTLLLANPASIAGSGAGCITMGARKGFVDDISSEVYGSADIGMGRLAAGAFFLDNGTAKVATADGSVRTVSAQQDLLFLAGWAGSFGGMLSAGATFKYLSSEFFEVDEGRAYICDAGVRAPVGSTGAVGLAVRNAGTDLEFGRTKYPLPSEAALGALWGWVFDRPVGGPPDTLTAVADVIQPLDKRSDIETGFRAGVEYLWAGMTALRFGARMESMEMLGRYSAGIGFMRGAFRFDYAMRFGGSGTSPQAASLTIAI